MDLHQSFSKEQWLPAFRIANTAFQCVTHQEAILKTNLRWYYTPTRLHRMFSSVPPEYWRRCGERGSLLHILWSCPKLSQLCINVQNLIAEIISTSPAITPVLDLLFIGLDILGLQHRTVVTHILIATKLVITRHWKAHAPLLYTK